MATNSTYIMYGTGCYISVNGTDLGHLIGDVEISMEVEEYYPDLSRARGPVAGTGKIVGASGSIKGTLAEWQYATLAALYSMGASSTADSEKIGSGALGVITELTSVIVTGNVRNDAMPFRFTIAKARTTSPVATALKEAEESGLDVTFEALYTDGAPATMPCWLEIEK